MKEKLDHLLKLVYLLLCLGHGGAGMTMETNYQAESLAEVGCVNGVGFSDTLSSWGFSVTSSCP